MAGTKTLILTPETLMSFLTHYTEGEIPLDGRILGVGANAALNRLIGIVIEGDWSTDDVKPDGTFDPYHFRLHGHKMKTWSRKGDEWQVFDTPEALKRK